MAYQIIRSKGYLSIDVTRVCTSGIKNTDYVSIQTFTQNKQPTTTRHKTTMMTMKLRSSAKATMSNCGPPHPSSYQAHPSVNALRCLHALEGRPFACRPPAPSTNNDDEGMNSSPCQNGGSPPARSSSRGYPPPSDHFPSSWTPHCEVLTSTAGNITAPRLRGLFIFIGDRIA